MLRLVVPCLLCYIVASASHGASGLAVTRTRSHSHGGASVQVQVRATASTSGTGQAAPLALAVSGSKASPGQIPLAVRGDMLSTPETLSN